MGRRSRWAAPRAPHQPSTPTVVRDRSSVGFVGYPEHYPGDGLGTVAGDRQAAAWCEYLAAHARRLYGAVTDTARVAAALLATRLAHGRLASPFTAREVYRQEWTGLTEPRVVQGALECLQELGWIRPEALGAPDGGRPTVRFHLNPRLRAEATNRPDRLGGLLRKSNFIVQGGPPAHDRFVGFVGDSRASPWGALHQSDRTPRSPTDPSANRVGFVSPPRGACWGATCLDRRPLSPLSSP